MILPSPTARRIGPSDSYSLLTIEQHSRGQVQTDWDTLIPHFTRNHPGNNRKKGAFCSTFCSPLVYSIPRIPTRELFTCPLLCFFIACSPFFRQPRHGPLHCQQHVSDHSTEYGGRHPPARIAPWMEKRRPCRHLHGLNYFRDLVSLLSLFLPGICFMERKGRG